MAYGTCVRRHFPAPVAVALLAALILQLAPATAAQAAMAAACPAETPSVGVGGTHGPAIDCLHDWGIAIWPAASYDQHRPVARGEFAALLARTLDATGHDGKGATSHAFPDVAGHPHERAIARLADLEVLRGYPDGTFQPNATISRAQMATMLMQLAVGIYDIQVTVSNPLPFVDVNAGGSHTDNIALIAAAGITRGVTADLFNPGGTVSRGQVTTFVARTLGLAVHHGTAVRDGSGDVGRWRDGATQADPGWNDGQFDPDRFAAMDTSFDYARYPLCAEFARSHMVTHFLAVSSTFPLTLGFDDSHAGQSCVWTRQGSDLEVVALQQPGSVWSPGRYEADGCFVMSADMTRSGAGVGGAGQSAWCTGGGVSTLHLQMGSHVYTVTLNVERSGDNRYLPQSRALAWLAPTAAVVEGIDPELPFLGDDWR